MHKAAREKLCKERPHEWFGYIKNQRPFKGNPNYLIGDQWVECKWCHINFNGVLESVVKYGIDKPCLSVEEKIIKDLLE
jgi:hypothetical protein